MTIPRLGCAVSLALLGACRDSAPAPETAPLAVDPGPPTFTRDVAPILFRHCGACHVDGGAAPFPLVDYDDVRDHASQIVELTASRTMPPWLPAPGVARYVGERRLTDGELSTLAKWVEAGRLEGDAADLPAPPQPVTGWRLGPPDVVLEAERAFDLPADGGDVYRNFVIEVPPEAEGWIKTIELQPGDPQVVHHAVLRVDRSGTAAARDAEDPAPGFDGMDFAGATMPDGRFLGWTPGKAPDPGQVARAFRLAAGSHIVLQVHMRASGKPQRVKPRLGVHKSDRPATRTALAMELASTDIELSPGATDVHVRDRFALPVDVFVVSVYPHAHYLGKRVEGYAELPDGSKKWLIRIDDWNFDWQDQYRLAEPIALPAGSTLVMDWTFDNGADNPHNPSSPPVAVRFGPRSTDEMAELILEIEPANPADLGRLDQAFMNGWLDRQIAYHDRTLAKAPDDADALFGKAALVARRGRNDEAIALYRRALAIAPERTAARVDLAIVRMSAGDLEGAKQELTAAIARAPDDARAHLTMGNVLRKQKQPKQAVPFLVRATELAPTSTDAWNNLGIAQEQAGDLAGAEASLRRATELAPGRVLFAENLARVLAAAGKDADALAAYRAILEADQTSVGALKGMAAVLLRTAEAGSSNARRAVDAAERAAKATGGRDPTVLELLVLAYMAAGNADKAKNTAQAALALARGGTDGALVERLTSRLEELSR
jgi:tetratricopeptide (TPR) repeat protein/mono/diheme cytochrome c family protein